MLAHPATFARRKTPIPTEPPDALTPAFATDEQKQRQWDAFKRDLALDPGPLADVVAALHAFLMPAAKAARGSHETFSTRSHGQAPTVT